MRKLAAISLAAALAGCATPYQEMGPMGGVRATRLGEDLVQVTARGNGYTDPDTIQQFVLRRAAVATVEYGFDWFEVAKSFDRSSTETAWSGYAAGGFAGGSAYSIFRPGETVMVRMHKGAAPKPAPFGTYDARELLRYMADPKVPLR